jgi:hypothetical protein
MPPILRVSNSLDRDRMSFRFDLHVHSLLSHDGSILPGPALARKIKSRGLDGIALTDHDTTRNVVRFVSVLGDAGLVAIPGEEVRASNGAEILCFFTTATIKPKMHWTEILDEVRSQGAIAVLSHPFDYLRGNWMGELSAKHRDSRLALLRGVDGLETFNARNYSPGGNWLAHRYASAAGLRETAGSDAHVLFEIGLTWTEIESASSNPDDLLAAFQRGNVAPHFREELGVVPVPGYTARRAVASVVKKTASGLSSAFSPVKRWLAVISR